MAWRSSLVMLGMFALAIGCVEQPAPSVSGAAGSSIDAPGASPAGATADAQPAQGASEASPPDRTVTDLFEELPVAAVWLDSPGHVPADQAVRIAIWEDGHVLFGEKPDQWGAKFMLGRLSPEQVRSIKEEVTKAEVFELKGHCYLVPSASVICMLARCDGQEQLLYWDEVESPNYGININPQPHHLDFIRAWKAANRTLVSAIPEEFVEVDDVPSDVPRSWYVKRAIQSE